MLAVWMQDIESLEGIAQDDDARRIFLRMAAMSETGRLDGFISQLAHDDELDEDMKGTLTEIARERSFLLAVQEYLRRTQRFH
jgi:hypothetical protein